MTDQDENIAGQFQRVVDNLSQYVGSLRDEGVRSLEVDKREMAALTAVNPAPAPTRAPATPQSEHPSVTAGEEEMQDLQEIAKTIAGCTLCPLHETRNKTVPGQGSLNPDIVFIGEGPGADEDREGIAFIGRAGKLLTKIIEAMGYTRDEVWIGNIVKCRPPNNRKPYPDEMECCLPYLKKQLALLQPKVIVCLGATAVNGLLDVQTGITKLRGTWMTFEGIDVMPTFHPAYLLRNPKTKRDVWEDMKSVLNKLGRPVPKKK